MSKRTITENQTPTLTLVEEESTELIEQFEQLRGAARELVEALLAGKSSEILDDEIDYMVEP